MQQVFNYDSVFCDGLSVTNPLRGQGSLLKVCVFYCSVRNLPREFTSCFGNVHLQALRYANDLSVYSHSDILEKFVSEINMLRTEGFEGTFPI
jgi:hypothetical protein